MRGLFRRSAEPAPYPSGPDPANCLFYEYQFSAWEIHLVVTAGFAELAAGSIAMGLGGYLAARSDAEHFETETKREQLEIIEKTQMEEQEVYDIFSK